ncbi:hypothetical protein CI109_103273 [Kwoniella shandongensis]|uniref:Uncharacterized protein n=1 Tax=Kwoniella shandongensis TaxID=1734106 RepID=A0A5M6BRS6_9TREE|nr:uncharacterized protein CI109_006055 [Kwoniella shandongensis]KAA5525604.1 hypothetical protein CI109_006055 [Kwoniella shandongensis]
MSKTTASTIKGRCNCGRYTISMPKPDQMNLCHCVDCRRWSGAMYSAHLITDTSNVTLEGTPEPRTHKVVGIKGMDMVRAWCDECGSGLWISPGGDPSKRYFKAGLFNPGDLPKPTFETFTKDMESWEQTAESTKQFEENLDGL